MGRFGITASYASEVVKFLLKMELIRAHSGSCALSHVMESWLSSGDDASLIAQLHVKAQFIGEMLEVLADPKTASELLQHANEQYGMGWTVGQQINTRRGWLQPAGLMGCTRDKLLYRTDAGTAFLDLVEVEPPLDRRTVKPTADGAVTERLVQQQQDSDMHGPMRPTRVPWERRTKAVDAMPGGVSNYFESIRWTADQVREHSLSPRALMDRMASHYSISDEYSRLSVGFLRKLGLLHDENGVCVLPDVMHAWLRDNDLTPLMVILHDKVRFIGEMLAALDVPQNSEELHRWANEKYRMSWKSRGQIGLRRAWLQSAGFVRLESNRFHRTDSGTAFLDLVVVEPPFEDHHTTRASLAEAEPAGASRVDEELPVDAALDGTPASRRDAIATELADRIISAATDAANHSQFERVVSEAFDFLGFEAEHLGGSGKTDVLIKARLGRDDSYRVAIDAKTTSSPALQDQQVDWVTLKEHRSKHEADYSMLVGPNPSTRRLLARAESQGVAILSADALADLCRKHAAQPLQLADYRSMFEHGGEADLSMVGERYRQARSRVALAKRLLYAIGEDAERFGRVTARDLHRGLSRDEGQLVATEPEIQGLLDTLASPLVGAISGDPGTGYLLACSLAVTADRLRSLGMALSAG